MEDADDHTEQVLLGRAVYTGPPDDGKRFDAFERVLATGGGGVSCRLKDDGCGPQATQSYTSKETSPLARGCGKCDEVPVTSPPIGPRAANEPLYNCS